MTPKRPSSSMHPSNHNSGNSNNSQVWISYNPYLWVIQLKPYFQPKSTVLHVQRRDSPRKPPLSSQPIKVQVPKSLIVQPINKEKQRVVLKNQPYQTKQAFMLQTPNKPISNTISVPTTVYQKPINPRLVQAWLGFRDHLGFSAPTTVYQKPMNQIFLKDSANKTFHVIQRPKQNDGQSSSKYIR